MQIWMLSTDDAKKKTERKRRVKMTQSVICRQNGDVHMSDGTTRSLTHKLIETQKPLFSVLFFVSFLFVRHADAAHKLKGPRDSGIRHSPLTQYSFNLKLLLCAYRI